jgi:aquaporin Z
MTQYGTESSSSSRRDDEDEAQTSNWASGKAKASDAARGVLETCAPYVAEFVGTALVVFTMGCAHFAGDKMWNPTAIACILTVSMYSFGPVSGAHLNPAITLAMVFSFKFPWNELLGHVVPQVAGAFCGSLAYWSIFATFPLPKPELWGYIDIGIVETLYTFVMAFVFLNCVSSARNNREDDQNHFFALAVGFVYIAGGYAAQDISGGILNPAASLAIGVTAGTPLAAVIYCGWQVLGCWLASLAYAIVRPEEFKLQYDGPLEDFQPLIRSKLFGEMLGTFVVVATAGLNTVMGSVAGPWSSAAAYISMIYSLGDVSGGHFNPAVTLAAVMTRRNICSITMGQAYVFQQLLGGALAGLLFSHFDTHTLEPSADALQPKAGFTMTQVCCAELFFTSLFAFVYLAVSTSTMAPSLTKTNFYFAFAIGSCMTIGGFAIGAISGGALNPAVAVGIAVSQIMSLGAKILNANSFQRIMHLVWYACYELGGGALGACIFALTHQKEYLKDGTNYPHVP